MLDLESLARHHNLEFVEDTTLLLPTIRRPRPTAPPRGTGNVNTYLYDDVIGRLNAANVRTGN
jgi:hypothetical protein